MEKGQNLENVLCISNSRAQNTKQSGLNACVDWVSVTFTYAKNPYDLIAVLGLDETKFEYKETGLYGYKNTLKYKNILILFHDDKPNIYLQMSGQGCRQYEKEGKHDWHTLFGLFMMLNPSFRRLDLAIDDFEGYFKITTLYRKLRQLHVTSRFKEWRQMISGKISSKEISGHTIYLGHPTSKIQIRFYDKLAERKKKKVEVTDDITFWNRTEIQLRDTRADKAAAIIAEDKISIMEEAAGILRNYITFLNPTKQKNGKIDKNKSRWKVCRFWEKFLNDAKKIKLTESKVEKTLEETQQWFDKYMAPTLATIVEAHDYDFTLIEKLIIDGSKRQNEKQKEMVKRFKAEKEEKKINLEKMLYEKRIKNIGKKFEVNKNGQIVPIARLIDEYDIYQMKEKERKNKEIYLSVLERNKTKIAKDKISKATE